MKENGVAKALQGIGYAVLVCAIIVSFLSDVDEILGIDFGLFIIVNAIITCYVFLGFAEIIDLLHKNGKKKDAIYDLLKERLSTNGETTKSVIEDIEANLPEM